MKPGQVDTTFARRFIDIDTERHPAREGSRLLYWLRRTHLIPMTLESPRPSRKRSGGSHMRTWVLAMILFGGHSTHEGHTGRR